MKIELTEKEKQKELNAKEKKRLYPFSEENEENPTICARCGSRDEKGRLIRTRDICIGQVGQGLCEKCIAKLNIPSEQERKPFEFDITKKPLN
jgi:hypothetical protein